MFGRSIGVYFGIGVLVIVLDLSSVPFLGIGKSAGASSEMM